MSFWEFLSAGRDQLWDKVREMIVKDPQLIWEAVDGCGFTIVTWVIHWNNVEMLQYMAEAIRSFSQTPQQEEQLLKYTFEYEERCGGTPTQRAVGYGHIECLSWLMRNAPSGAAVLEEKDESGNTASHEAAHQSRMNALEFIVRNAPSGVKVLMTENDKGKTPLTKNRGAAKKYFTPQKIRELAFERESEVIRTALIFDSDSLVQLMLSVVVQNIELQLYRNAQVAS